MSRAVPAPTGRSRRPSGTTGPQSLPLAARENVHRPTEAWSEKNGSEASTASLATCQPGLAGGADLLLHRAGRVEHDEQRAAPVEGGPVLQGAGQHVLARLGRGVPRLGRHDAGGRRRPSCRAGRPAIRRAAGPPGRCPGRRSRRTPRMPSRCSSLTQSPSSAEDRHLADDPALGRVDGRDLDGRLGGVEGDDLLLGRRARSGGRAGPRVLVAASSRSAAQRAGEVARRAVDGVVRGDEAAAQVVGGLGADRQVAVDRDGRPEPGGRGQRVGPVEAHRAPLGVLDRATSRPGRRPGRCSCSHEGWVSGQPSASAIGRGGGEDDGRGGDDRVGAWQHAERPGGHGPAPSATARSRAPTSSVRPPCPRRGPRPTGSANSCGEAA